MILASTEDNLHLIIFAGRKETDDLLLRLYGVSTEKLSEGYASRSVYQVPYDILHAGVIRQTSLTASTSPGILRCILRPVF